MLRPDGSAMFTGGHISFAAYVKRIAAGPSEAGQSMSSCPSSQMNPLKLCRRILLQRLGGGSLLIPQIEISHELGERLGSVWKRAKAELIGHQCPLCVKSHLFTTFYESFFTFATSGVMSTSSNSQY